MNVVIKNFVDFEHMVIPLGFVGENNHTKIIINSKSIFDEYPSAIPAMMVKPPVGDKYEAVVTREDDNVVWVVQNTDLENDGIGGVQLSFSENGTIIRSYISKTRIHKSIKIETK